MDFSKAKVMHACDVSSFCLFLTFVIFSYSLSPVPPICSQPSSFSDAFGEITISKTWTDPNKTFTNAAMTPAIIDVDGDSFSDIIVVVYNTPTDTAVVALSGAPNQNLTLLWMYRNNTSRFSPYPYSGIGVATTETGGLICFQNRNQGQMICLNFSGEFLFSRPINPPVNTIYRSQISIINVDMNGTWFIIAGNIAFNLVGDLMWNASKVQYVNEFDISDLNNDGIVELIYPDRILNSLNGTFFKPFNQAIYSTFDNNDLCTYAHVADFDGDGIGDILKLGNKRVSIWNCNGTRIALFTRAGNKGNAMIRDINNDGHLDFGFEITNKSFEMYTFNKTSSQIGLIWKHTIKDEGYSGAMTADLNGDGYFEVLFADVSHFYIFAANGTVLYNNTSIRRSGTWVEYPLYVDLDNDGSGEIILVNNNRFEPKEKLPAITVLSPKNKENWTPTTSVWKHWGATSYEILDQEYNDPLISSSPWFFDWKHGNFYKGTINTCFVCAGVPDPFFLSYNISCVALRWTIFEQSVVNSSSISSVSLNSDVDLNIQTDFVLEINSTLNIIVSETQETGSIFVKGSFVQYGHISIDLTSVDFDGNDQIELRNIISFKNANLSIIRIDQIDVQTNPSRTDSCFVGISQIPEPHSLSLLITSSQQCDDSYYSDDNNTENNDLLVGLTAGLVGGCICLLIIIAIVISIVLTIKKQQRKKKIDSFVLS